MLVLQTLGAKPNPGNPYNDSKSEKPFGTFGGPDVAAMLAEVAARAINAVSYGPNSRSGGSRGGSFIEVKQSAKPFSPPDGTRHGRPTRRKRNDVANALVISLGVIVRHKLLNSSASMTLAQRDDVPQAFLPNRTNEPLGERVQIRTASRQSQKFHTRRSQHAFEVRGVQRVAIYDQIDEAAQGTGDRVGEIARDLRHRT